MSTAANPRAPKPDPDNAPRESTGAVTSDSLAAESMKAGGGFSENENAHAQSVKGANSTFNTTDTSGATVLPAARDGATREDNSDMGMGSDERGTTGTLYPDAGRTDFDGTHSQEGYVGGSGQTTKTSVPSAKGAYTGATGDSFADNAGPTSSGGDSEPSSSAIRSGKAATSSATSSSGGSGSAATDAPNYAATVSGAIRPEGEQKPKGENLTEGGIPQTKTFTGDVGGVHDPGRLAEQDFEKVSARNAATASTQDYSGSSESQSVATGGAFDALSSERAPDADN